MVVEDGEMGSAGSQDDDASRMGHRPVLAEEVAQALLPSLEHGGILVDATLGRAGTRGVFSTRPFGRLHWYRPRDPEALEGVSVQTSPRTAAGYGSFVTTSKTSRPC